MCDSRRTSLFLHGVEVLRRVRIASRDRSVRSSLDNLNAVSSCQAACLHPLGYLAHLILTPIIPGTSLPLQRRALLLNSQDKTPSQSCVHACMRAHCGNQSHQNKTLLQTMDTKIHGRT